MMKMVCIHDETSDTDGLEMPVLFKTYTLSNRLGEKNVDGLPLWFEELPYGYPSSWFITLKEYRKRKLKKIL